MADNKRKNTHQRLLEVACEIFAERGYRNTTIVDICERADANIALVNYHFGDKKSLYNSVWHSAFHSANSAFPLDGEVNKDATPEEKLRGCIRAILNRIFAKGNAGWFPQLLIHEMVSPTLELSRIVDEAIRPQTDYVMGVISILLGRKASERDLANCLMSTLSQCFMLSLMAPVGRELFLRKPLTRKDILQMTDHIVSFSLAGISEYRKRLEAK